MLEKLIISAVVFIHYIILHFSSTEQRGTIPCTHLYLSPRTEI